MMVNNSLEADEAINQEIVPNPIFFVKKGTYQIAVSVPTNLSLIELLGMRPKERLREESPIQEPE